MAKTPRPRCRSGRIDIPRRPRSRIVWLCDDANGLRVGVVPADGGEVAGIRYRDGRRWHELLYLGLNYDPNPPLGWPGRAPVLWPVVGRTHTQAQIDRFEKTGRSPRTLRYELDGKVYPIDMHGFVRKMPWELTECGADAKRAWAVCHVAATPATRRQYPFDFGIDVEHSVTNGEIRSLYTVRAGANDRPMPFCIGNHIGFNMPFFGKGDYMQCAVKSPGKRRCLLGGPRGLTGKTEPMDLATPVPLGAGVYSDTFVMGYTRRNAWAEVSDPFSGLTVRVSQAERPVKGRYLSKEKDLAYVIWGKPEDNQICPEPWLGAPSAITTGKHLLELAPHGVFKWEMRVAFEPLAL